MVTSLARSGEIIQPQQQQQRTSCALGKHYLTPAVAISKWTDLIGWDSRNARALTVICQVSRRWIETENLEKGIEFLGNDKERLSMLLPIFFFCVAFHGCPSPKKIGQPFVDSNCHMKHVWRKTRSYWLSIYRVVLQKRRRNYISHRNVQVHFKLSWAH